MIRRRTVRLLVGGALASAVAGPPARALAAPPLGEAELLELVRRAPPAPNPQPDDPVVELSDDAARQADLHVTAAGRALEVAIQGGHAAALSAAVQGGAAPFAPAFDGLSAAAGAVMPALILDTRPAPWRMVAKLLMRFDVDGASHYFACSGVMIGPFHVLTAAHCVFNWDPDGDGVVGGERFADEVWVWPAQTDALAPFGVPERPYGDALAVASRAYRGWTVANDVAWDLALVTLNRRVGDGTHWMELEADQPVAGLAFSGYPVEEPYVARNTMGQYGGSGEDDVLAYGRQLQLSAYTYGGHSGGPVWRTGATPDECWVQGVLSLSDRAGFATATLVTPARADDLHGWMAADETTRQPVPRPDLCENVLAEDAKGVVMDTVRAGDTLGVMFNLRNTGAAASGPVTVDFYLSTNWSISEKDVFVARRALDDLAAGDVVVAFAELPIPAEVSPGDYYVGWMMQATETEYSTVNNSAVIGDQVLHVVAALTPTPTGTAGPTATTPPEPTRTAFDAVACPGDCDGDLAVTVAELVRVVAIGLGMAPIDACPSGDADGDGHASIAEVIGAVRHALDGCR